MEVRGQVSIIRGYRPGAMGRITEMHGRYYAREWGFDVSFEAEVAGELAEFMGRFVDDRDGLWLALDGDVIVGSIAIDGLPPREQGRHGDGARLRWFLVDPGHHGRGLGRRLMEEAMAFCRSRHGGRVYLLTIAGLEAARALYEKFGFVLAEEHEETLWGRTITDRLYQAGGEEPAGG